jgi:urease accessory protein UreF
MISKAQITAAPVVEMLGDPHPLIEQLGSPGGLGALAGAFGAAEMGQVRSLPELRAFLQDYHARILRPLELPAIQRSFGHAARGEARELIAFDEQLAGEPALQVFAAASRVAGQRQLNRLRPLRDARLVQRYLAAVESGAANGWHTLVFGLTLAVYSFPLRQGLLAYAQLTTRGFIDAASQPLAISKEDREALCEEICEGLPAATEPLLTPGLVS